MPIIRTIVASIFVLLLIIFLSMSVIFYAGAKLTDYNNLKPVAGKFIVQQAAQIGIFDINQVRTLLVNYCNTSGKDTVNVPNTIVELKCSELNKNDNITSVISNTVFDNFYYKDYGCEFLECINSNKLKESDKTSVLISSVSNKFFSNFLVLLVILSIVSAVLIMAMLRNLSKSLLYIGFGIFVAGLPYFFISNFVPALPKDVALFKPILDSAILSLLNAFMTLLIIGIVLFALGIIFRLKAPKNQGAAVQPVQQSEPENPLKKPAVKDKRKNH